MRDQITTIYHNLYNMSSLGERIKKMSLTYSEICLILSDSSTFNEGNLEWKGNEMRELKG